MLASHVNNLVIKLDIFELRGREGENQPQLGVWCFCGCTSEVRQRQRVISCVLLFLELDLLTHTESIPIPRHIERM